MHFQVENSNECEENEKNNLFLLNLLLNSGNENLDFNSHSNNYENERSPTVTFWFFNQKTIFQLHELFNFNPINSLLENAIEQNNTDKSNEDNEDNEILPYTRPTGIIESKAMRKTTCQVLKKIFFLVFQVCKINICSTARQRHVYLTHLAKHDLFECSECDYTNSNSIWELRKHCVAQHGPEAVALSNEEKHKDAIMASFWGNLIIFINLDVESKMFS